jgi:uncharacterized protein YndB with AHSA1/START domain
VHDSLWPALTDPGRLARWLGEVDGELHRGGELRGRFFASGWEGTCRVEVCEPPRRLLLVTTSEGEPDGVFEVTRRDSGRPLPGPTRPDGAAEDRRSVT